MTCIYKEGRSKGSGIGLTLSLLKTSNDWTIQHKSHLSCRCRVMQKTLFDLVARQLLILLSLIRVIEARKILLEGLNIPFWWQSWAEWPWVSLLIRALYLRRSADDAHWRVRVDAAGISKSLSSSLQSPLPVFLDLSLLLCGQLIWHDGQLCLN